MSKEPAVEGFYLGGELMTWSKGSKWIMRLKSIILLKFMMEK